MAASRAHAQPGLLNSIKSQGLPWSPCPLEPASESGAVAGSRLAGGPNIRRAGEYRPVGDGAPRGTQKGLTVGAGRGSAMDQWLPRAGRFRPILIIAEG